MQMVFIRIPIVVVLQLHGHAPDKVYHDNRKVKSSTESRMNRMAIVIPTQGDAEVSASG